MAMAPKYCWLPNGDISYLETNARGLPQVCYRKVDTAGAGPVRFGPELPPGPPYYSVTPSPDEQWVAYTREVGAPLYQTTVVSAVGKPKAAFKEQFVGWLSDNRSFLTVTFAAPPITLKVHHLDSASIESIPQPEGWTTPFVMTRRIDSPDFLISDSFAQPMPGSPLARNYPNMTQRTFQAAKPGIVPQTWTVSAPDATFGATVASPDNKHLLWVTTTRKPVPMDQWLHRLFPKRTVAFKTSTDYYISDLHGNHRHPIMEGGLNRVPYLAPTWTPDSKHLSFLYNNHLYLVPVD